MNDLNPSGHEICCFDFDVLLVNILIEFFWHICEVEIAKLMHIIVLKILP
jgi:hypothetical protein